MRKKIRFKIVAITCSGCLLINYLAIAAVKFLGGFDNAEDFLGIVFCTTLAWCGIMAGFWYEGRGRK
jgi:hypothetical protein